MSREEAAAIEEAATKLARSHGMTFSASGAASEPGMSLKRRDDGSPWSMCRRPWTVMYFTANGRALPCCIAPFSQRGYENYTLGDATQQTLARNLEWRRLPFVSRGPVVGSAAGRLRQLWVALEPVTDGGGVERQPHGFVRSRS